MPEIHLAGITEPQESDWETASKCIAPQYGVVVVEMFDAPEARSGILMPDGRMKINPDIGTVLAAHDDIPIFPGDVVVVDGIHGKWMTGFTAGEYKAKRQVRIFGRAVRTDGKPSFVDWSSSILATMDWTKDIPLRPKEHWVLIDRGDVTTETEGGILLPEQIQSRPCKGKVLAKGGKAVDVHVGGTYLYMANTVRPVRGMKDSFRDVPKNVALVDSRMLLAEVWE